MNFHIKEVLTRGVFNAKALEFQFVSTTGYKIVKASTKLDQEEYLAFVEKYGQEACDVVGLKVSGEHVPNSDAGKVQAAMAAKTGAFAPKARTDGIRDGTDDYGLWGAGA